MIKSVLLILLLVLVLPIKSFAGTCPARYLDRLSLGMTKQEVVRKMGSSGIARGALMNKYGQAIEVKEYKIEQDKEAKRVCGEVCFTILTLGIGSPVLFSDGEIDTYWLYFHDGFLVSWGQAGDWAEAERQVYDVNFNVSYNQ